MVDARAGAVALKVWVNGQVLGISPRESFAPFEMDATEAIRPGKMNTVVVCVSNMTLNDSGPGSLRHCLEASGPRICVFRVSGTITLKNAIRCTCRTT